MAATAFVLVGGFVGVKAYALARSSFERLAFSPEASYSRLSKGLAETDSAPLRLYSSREVSFISNHPISSLALRIFAFLGAVFAMGSFGFIGYLLGKSVLLGTALPNVTRAAGLGLLSFLVSKAAHTMYLSKAEINDWR
ncbi:MAG TPA: hypothetical protein VGM34_01990 [Chlamydiales bacterium]|jgi:hypothetical protein